MIRFLRRGLRTLRRTGSSGACVLFLWTLSGSFPAVSAEPVLKTVWREDFDALPKDWEVRGKPGTPRAKFEAVTIAADTNATVSVLRMTADAASSSVVASLPAVDLRKTPILRWRWRVIELPAGADGLDPKKDDQAIGVYVSAGGMFSQRSVAYRWETETPVGASGTAKYAGGVARVQWFCLHNRGSASNEFVVESRNVAEDFKKAYGEIPEKIGLSISCNSQYTGGKAAAELDWIEFVAEDPVPSAKETLPTTRQDK